MHTRHSNVSFKKAKDKNNCTSLTQCDIGLRS